jgi:hypothetical protein
MVVIACLLFVFAARTAVSDFRLATALRTLSAGKLEESVRAWNSARDWAPPGFNSSLWFSMTLFEVSRQRNQVRVMLPAILRAAEDACRHAEDRHNACYHLAMLWAHQGEPSRAIALLRESSAMAPTWYVPYWSMALVYQTEGDLPAAKIMAARAINVGGKHRAEISQWLESIQAARALH